MEQLIKRKFIVFALDHYNPLGAIRSLGEAGIKPIFIAVRHRVDLGVKSKYLDKCYIVNSVSEGYELLINEYGMYEGDERPFLITCDDRTAGYLDERYEELKNRFIFFNANGTNRITMYMDKNKILECAKRHGLKVLETIVVERGVVPKNIEYPIITKSISPNVGGWKSDVNICYSEKELIEAYNKIQSPTVLLQKYIEKKNEYCLDGFCADNGNIMFTTIASTYNYIIPGYYSPYMTVTNFTNDEMKKSLEGMMMEIGYEGIYSIEFLIDQNGEYWFSEINFRNSTWSYASTVAGMSLPVMWAESMLTKELPRNGIKKIPDGFTAMVEPVDYAKRVEEGKVSIEEWLYDFKRCECPFYYSKNDPEPFFEMINNFEKLG